MLQTICIVRQTIHILLATKQEIVFLFVSKIKKALQTFSFTFAGHSKVPIKNAISSGEFSRSSSLFQMLFDDFDVSLIISLVEFFNHDSDTLGTAGTLIAER